MFIKWCLKRSISLENSEVSWLLVFSPFVSTCLGLATTVHTPFFYLILLCVQLCQSWPRLLSCNNLRGGCHVSSPYGNSRTTLYFHHTFQGLSMYIEDLCSRQFVHVQTQIQLENHFPRGQEPRPKRQEWFCSQEKSLVLSWQRKSSPLPAGCRGAYMAVEAVLLFRWPLSCGLLIV